MASRLKMNSNSLLDGTRLKILLLGGIGCGKTTLVTSFYYGHPIYPEKPVLYGAFSKDLQIGERSFSLNVCDTAGAKEYGHLRKMAFLDADLLVLCVSGDDRNGLNGAEEFIHCSSDEKYTGKLVLCLTKSDLGIAIPKEEVDAFTSKNRIKKVVECAANDNKSVRSAFEKFVEVAISEEDSTKYSCCFNCF